MHTEIMLFYILVINIPHKISEMDVESVFESWEQLDYLYKGNWIVLGDLNDPRFVENKVSDAKTSVILSFLALLSLMQYSSISNHCERFLDLVMSHFDCMVASDDSPLVSEDSRNPFLIFDISNILSKEPDFKCNPCQRTYNCREINFPELHRELYETDWHFLPDFDNDIIPGNFYHRILSIIDKPTEIMIINIHLGLVQILSEL